MKTKLKIKGYFVCGGKTIKNLKTNKWERVIKPCNYKTPIYDLKKARKLKHPICKCGCITALYDIELNREVNKIFRT